jgi:hypothetical protein
MILNLQLEVLNNNNSYGPDDKIDYANKGALVNVKKILRMCLNKWADQLIDEKKHVENNCMFDLICEPCQ